MDVSKAEVCDLLESVSVLVTNKDRLSVTVFCFRNRKVARATKILHGKTKYWSGGVVLTLCKPNYREREFLKACRQVKTSPRRHWVNRIRRDK